MTDVENCQRLTLAMGWSVVIRVTSTSALFFLRLKAIMNGHRWIIAFYALLWLCNAGVSIISPFSFMASHLASTKRCIDTTVKSQISYQFLSDVIYDTFIYFGITLMLALSLDGLGTRPKPWWNPKNMPALTQAIWQGGQLYYL